MVRLLTGVVDRRLAHRAPTGRRRLTQLVRTSRLDAGRGRAQPPLYPPSPGTSFGVRTSHVRHVKGVGQDAYTYYVNAGHGGVYTADVLTSKGVTSVTLAETAGNADTALTIARMVMNR